MTIEHNNYLAKKLRIYREERGWNQKELAEKADVSASTISKAERGVYTPNPDKLRKIADALGIPFHELIDPASELEVSTLVMIVKIFVERKEYHHALQHIAELEKRGDLLEHQKQDVILYKAESLMRTGGTTEAISLLSELRASLEKTQAVDEHFVADVYNRLGNAFFLSSNITHAHAHYMRAHQLALTFTVFDLLAAKITYNLGMACSRLKNPSEATEHLEKAEKFFRDVADSVRLAETLFAQGRCYFDLNKLELAERCLVESLALYQSHNLMELAQQVKYSLASTVTAAQEFELGIEQLLECAENFKALGRLPRVAFTYVRIAELHIEKGHFFEADQYLVEALQILQPVELPEYDHNNVYSFYYKVLSKALLKKDKHNEAIEMSFKSSELFGKMGITRDEADSLEVAVDAYLKLGASDQAIQLSRRISDLLRQSLNSFPIMEVLR